MNNVITYIQYISSNILDNIVRILYYYKRRSDRRWLMRRKRLLQVEENDLL